MTDIDNLISEMQEVKQSYPTLEIPEILRLFSINAMNDLTKQIKRLA